MRGSEQVVSKWLGDYFLVAKDDRHVRLSLLRQINAQLRERDGIEKNVEKSALILQSILPVLLGERASSRFIRVNSEEGVLLDTAVTKKKIEAFFVQSGAANFPRADRLLILLAKLVFDSYQYGVIAEGYLFSINQPVLNCNTFSQLLMAYLKYFGLEASFVEISDGGGHAVVEVSVGTNKRVVDLTTGTIYLGSVNEIGTDFSPGKIQIGPVRVELDLPQMLRSASNLNWRGDIDLKRLQANF